MTIDNLPMELTNKNGYFNDISFAVCVSITTFPAKH